MIKMALQSILVLEETEGLAATVRYLWVYNTREIGWDQGATEDSNDHVMEDLFGWRRRKY